MKKDEREAPVTEEDTHVTENGNWYTVLTLDSPKKKTNRKKSQKIRMLTEMQGDTITKLIRGVDSYSLKKKKTNRKKSQEKIRMLTELREDTLTKPQRFWKDPRRGHVQMAGKYFVLPSGHSSCSLWKSSLGLRQSHASKHTVHPLAMFRHPPSQGQCVARGGITAGIMCGNWRWFRIM